MESVYYCVYNSPVPILFELCHIIKGFIFILADDYPALPGYLIVPILYHTNNIHQPIYIYIKDYTTAII
jgi:hypothetical protein